MRITKAVFKGIDDNIALYIDDIVIITSGTLELHLQYSTRLIDPLNSLTQLRVLEHLSRLHSNIFKRD